MIKVLIVEDHEIVRQGLKELLLEDAFIELLCEAKNGSEAVEMLESISPDVILMDINMPEMGGIEATSIIKSKYPMVQILILSMHNNKRFVSEALEAGASGYLLKNSKSNELLLAIRAVNRGERFIDSEIEYKEDN